MPPLRSGSALPSTRRAHVARGVVLASLVGHAAAAGRRRVLPARLPHGHLQGWPTKRPHKSPCSPSAAKILPLRGPDCSALRRTIPFMGGGASKRLQVRRKRTKTRSSPWRFWNSRSRSSILNGAPVRQLAMHWRLGSSGFCRRSTLQAGRGLSHAPGWGQS